MDHGTRYGESSGWGNPMIARTDGVLSRRLLAYLVDLAVIFILTLILGFLIGLLGVVTLGAAWLLYGILVPATAIGYSAVTVGGAGHGTIGMRMSGLAAIDASSGGGIGPLLAGLHALLFYVGIGTLLLLAVDLLIGLARADRRLGHDLVTGIVVVRR